MLHKAEPHGAALMHAQRDKLLQCPFFTSWRSLLTVAAPLALLDRLETGLRGLTMFAIPVVFHAASASLPLVETAQMQAIVGTRLGTAAHLFVPSPTDLGAVGQLPDEVLGRLE